MIPTCTRIQTCSVRSASYAMGNSISVPPQILPSLSSASGGGTWPLAHRHLHAHDHPYGGIHLSYRICPGRHFGMNGLFINVASVLHVFNITPPVDEKGQEIKIEPRLTSGLLWYVNRKVLGFAAFHIHILWLVTLRTADARSNPGLHEQRL